MGILLGDGNIRDFNAIEGEKHVTVYKTKVTLHRKEKEIIKNVETLFKEISGREPSRYDSKNSKAINIYLYSKEFIERLNEIGLKSGNKTKNQVSVPDWIKQNKNYEKACLKGLIDTDGTIYKRKNDEYTVVQFKNASKPLLDDFREMCGDLGISTSKGGYRTIQVASQPEVEKFLEQIDPIKNKVRNAKTTL